MTAYSQWIDDCRSLLNPGGKSLIGQIRGFFGSDPFVGEALVRDQRIRNRAVLRKGQVVWGAIVQANTDLYRKGPSAMPANLVYSLDPYFDSHPGHLCAIATRIAKLKDKSPADPILAKVAAIVTDEMNMIANWRIPFILADGHEAFLTSTMIHPRAPARWIAGITVTSPGCCSRIDSVQYSSPAQVLVA